MLIPLALTWLFLQLFRQRLNALFASLGNHFTVHLSAFSLHLSTTSPTLLRLPAALVERLPQLQRHGRGENGQDKRRLGVYWDLGALASLAGAVVAQVVLLVAAGKAVLALWTLLTGTAEATQAATSLVKRAPVDLAPLPSPPSNSQGGTAADDLLLRPLIPSLSSLPLLFVALAVSQGWHELGHALAAVSESIPLQSFGIHLIFLILPTPYVGVSSVPTSSSLPTTSSDFLPVALSPQTDLRIASAGVWHNMLMLTGAWLLSAEGGGWGMSLLKGVGAIQRGEEGVVVVEVDLHSPLASHLSLGTLITHLDDLELDASSAASGSTAKAWEDFLRPVSASKTVGSDPYRGMGWCLDEEVFHEAKADEECCSSRLKEEEEGPRFCFKASSSASTAPFQACLNLLPFLPPFPSSSSPPPPPPARCIDDSSCTFSHPGTICARIAPEEKVLRFGVQGREGGEGERRTVLWQGEREGVWRQVAVTDFEPQYWFIPLSFERTMERFLGAIISLSLSLIFFNLLPLPHLDGSAILSAFLSSLSPSTLPLTASRTATFPSNDDGVLEAVIRRLSRIGWLRRAAERRKTTEKWVKKWTIGVGGLALAATVLVELGTWTRG